MPTVPEMVLSRSNLPPEVKCPGGKLLRSKLSAQDTLLRGASYFVTGSFFFCKARLGLGLVLAGPVGNEQESEGDCFWKERQLSHCAFLVCTYLQG